MAVPVGNRVSMNEVESPDEWGPCMAALTEKQRNYIKAMACDPFGNPTAWARAAGYSDIKDGAKVRAHGLAHSPKIEAAVQEYSRALLHREGPMLAVAGLLRIARNESHPKNLQALDSLADRMGLARTTEHTVNVAHVDMTGAAMLERIRALAAKHGMDPAALLGPNTVEGEFTEIGGSLTSKTAGGSQELVVEAGKASPPDA